MIKLNTEYMIFAPKLELTKSDKEITSFTIADSKKVGDKYENDYYRIKVFGQHKLKDRQKIKIKSINMVNTYVSNGKDGKTYYNRELYCDLVDEKTNDNEVENIYELNKNDEFDMDLPF